MQVNYINLMNGAREARVTGLLEDEPVFVLRARDALALPALNQWIQMSGGLLTLGRSEQACADRDAFVEWRRENSDKLRDPD